MTNDSFAQEILRKKYLQEGEKDWVDLCERFRRHIPYKKLNDKIFELMVTKKWCPAGSILAGFGTEGRRSLSNCYVVPIDDDSLEGIFDAMRKMARTFSFRGGVGFDLSVLRPKGTPVNNAAKYSTGSVSFLPLFSAMVQTIGQKGRRGACLATMDIRHPDVVDFIKCKSSPEEVFGDDPFHAIPTDISGINLSVRVSDEFMTTASVGGEWELRWDGKVVRRIDGQELFRMIAEEAWRSGDPGVIFWDTVQRYSTTGFVEFGKPHSANPCGEQPLMKYGNCNLSSFNLLAYVSDDGERFDWQGLRDDVWTVVMFMDSVIDLNQHPLPMQTETDRTFRKIGIGITGLGDALAAMDIRYGSKEACEFAERVMFTLTTEAFECSVALASEKGSAPVLEDEEARRKFVDQPFFVERMPKELRADIIQKGCRNTAVTCIAPAGSISILLGNVTSGCEPLYEREYERVSRVTGESVKVKHPPMVERGIAPDRYVTAMELDWKERVAMQASLQKYCTDSISSTVNLPSNVGVDEIEQIYQVAWESGLKGITVYRDKSKAQQVLKRGSCDVMSADRHVVYLDGSKTYFNVTKDESQSPVEVFVSVPTSAGQTEDGEFEAHRYLHVLANWTLVARLISLCLRSGVGLEKVLRQIKKSRFLISDLPSLLYRVLSKYVDGEDCGCGCPKCGGKLVAEGGCFTCKGCGWTKCE